MRFCVLRLAFRPHLIANVTQNPLEISILCYETHEYSKLIRNLSDFYRVIAGLDRRAMVYCPLESKTVMGTGFEGSWMVRESKK